MMVFQDNGYYNGGLSKFIYRFFFTWFRGLLPVISVDTYCHCVDLCSAGCPAYCCRHSVVPEDIHVPSVR